MVDLAASVWRDFVTDGVPASGANKPLKSKIRTWGVWLEGIITAFTSNGGLIYSSLTAMNADLLHGANSSAWVIGDATVANNGIYKKVGASGTGSWSRVADLPYSYVLAADAGAGTANAIVATSTIPLPSSDGGALIACNIFEDNTGSPVTIAFNGAAALTVKTSAGNDIVAGGLKAGMIVAGYKSGTTFRLLSDQAAAAIQAAAEAAAAAAATSASQAAASAALVPPSVSTRAALKALNTVNVTTAFFDGSIWYFLSGDYSARVALDTAEGVFIKATAIAATAGCWVRQYTIAKPEMWGAVGAAASAANSTVPDEYAALQCMLNVVGYTGGAIQITPGKKFGTGTALFARITRQQAAVKTLVADIYISDKSSFKVYSDGSGCLVAKASIDTILTFQFNSAAVGGVTNSRGPDQSEVYGLMLDGNSLAAHGLKGDFTRGLNFHDNTIFDTTGSAITWLGSSAGYVSNNILKAPIGVECTGGAGGDLKIGPNQYFFPLAGGRAVKISDSGNIVVTGGTVNSESIASVIGVEIEATAGHNVRHVTVRDMEFSGCQIGVYAHTASATERIYGLVIDGNHTTSGSGFDRTSINPGTLVDLQRCDEALINDNLCNGRALSVSAQSAILLRSCRDVQIDGTMIENYSGEAVYVQGCDNVRLVGGSVRDVGQTGASTAIFDLDGSTNCSINPHRVVQTNVLFGQIGIIERAGSSGNSSDRVDWSGVGTPSSKTGSTDGRFRQFKSLFAEGKVTQVAGGPTLTFSTNCTATRPSIGRTTITFVTAHPTATGYRVNVAGVGCKVEVESVAAASFVILMLDLSDSPVDSSFMFEVVSLI